MLNSIKLETNFDDLLNHKNCLFFQTSLFDIHEIISPQIDESLPLEKII